jgi:fructokinase
MAIWGGIEAGGTKTVCAIGSSPNDLRERVRIPTTTPEETLTEIVRYFQERQKAAPLAAIGIASFGPVDPNPRSPTFGSITTTPKPGWAHTELAGVVRRELGVPVGFDTDVNAAALAEHRWGAAQGLDDFVYLTVGTGIGGGAMVHGQLLYGLNHPEMGHIRIPHDREVDPFPGFCPYHGDCLEGLAAGPALEARWGQPAYKLPADHEAWPLEATYLAHGLVNLSCILLPERFILGGGIMHQPRLLPLVRQRVQELLNGYLQVPPILDQIEEYIVLPGLGDRAGVLGALVLAQQAVAQQAAVQEAGAQQGADQPVRQEKGSLRSAG